MTVEVEVPTADENYELRYGSRRWLWLWLWHSIRPPRAGRDWTSAACSSTPGP
jgi:hypothetical protein